MRDINVALVGCGFLGSLYAEELQRRAMAHGLELYMTLVDGDVVEKRNLANQNFGLHQLGLDKAAALGENLTLVESMVVHHAYLKQENAKALLLGEERPHLVVCAVDNLDARQVLWNLCMSEGIPLLHLGISQGGTGAVDWSTAKFDSNPFSTPRLLQLSDKQRQEIEAGTASLPPCQLVGFRGLGLNMAIAASKATAIYFGYDSEREVFPSQEGPTGTLTTWQATMGGHTLCEKH